MRRRAFLRNIGGGAAAYLLGATASCTTGPGTAGAEKRAKTRRPNFLVIVGDDTTCSDLSCYGGTNIETPNIDRLAKEGMQFNYGYVAMSMCCPCRHELYTGLYPMGSGATWNHCRANPGVKSVCHHLGELGYRTALAGKDHVRPVTSYPFKRLRGFERGCCSKTARADHNDIRSFMTQDTEQPFFLAVCLVAGHTPWTVGDPDSINESGLKLPANFADIEMVRHDYAHYLAEVTYMDGQVGDILKTLKETGREENTFVLFTSEQGSQFPGAKWTNWEQGLHTAVIVRWPGQVKPGTETDALIQYADVVPTLIDAAGGDPAQKKLDGTSFLDVLHGKTKTHRTYAYGMHNNVPEGPPYPIRTIRSTKFRYIWNLTPDATYIEKHMEQPKRWGNHWEAWKKAAATDPHAGKMLERFRHRPEEELYLSNSDPCELVNIADDPAYADVKKKLRSELEKWMEREGDPGAARDDMQVLTANRRGEG